MQEATVTGSRPGAEVAEGVYRFGSRRVNWYVVEGDGGITVVDAGIPGHWDQLVDGLADLGYDLDDVQAVVLTHGHADHVGFAERLRETADVPVYVHEADVGLASGEDDRSVDPAVFLNLLRPAVLALLVEFARAGGLSITPVQSVEPYEDGDEIDVPGSPAAIHVPGHSAGSCALHLPDRGVLLCGDALATLDVKRGGRGPPKLMSLFNEDREVAIASPDRLESLGRVTLLPGHGDPWRGEMPEAVRSARRR